MGLFYLTDTCEKFEKVMWTICSSVLVVGGIATAVVAVYASKETESLMNELNGKIVRDLDVDSFDAQTIIFDKTDKNYLIRIAGSSPKASYITADYKVSEQDYYSIKPKQSDFSKVEEKRCKDLRNLIDILYRSEFLGKDVKDLAIINNGEIVLNVSKPYVDRKTNSMSYDLTIAQVQDSDLKLGTFKVSAPMSKELMQEPKSIYLIPSDQVEIEKLNVKTYKNVYRVEMHDESTIVI